MNSKTITSLALAILGLLMASCASGPVNLRDSKVEDVVKAMTKEQKLKILLGTNLDLEEKNSGPVVGQHSLFVPGAAGSTFSFEELGITNTVLADGPAGLRISPRREGVDMTFYCTYFPIGTLLASTWNQELIENVGKAMGEETKEYGADVLLAPALNIQRNPLCGRNFEYYSEDPLISGKTAAAYVRGIQSNGVGTSIKHFAANSQETNRKLNNAIISDRALREIYLKGFEIAVKESDPWTVMTSYNGINGTPTPESKPLLEGILRGEWDFKGMVMTDWSSGNDGGAQIAAGNDLIMPGNKQRYNEIVAALDNGSLTMADVDRDVKRILEFVKKTPRFQGYEYSDNPDLEAHAQITRQSSLEGMVLLKNEDATLPFASSISNIALLGYTSFDFIAGGTGSGSVNSSYVVSLLDGLKNGGYKVDERLKDANLANKGMTRQTGLLSVSNRPEEIIPDAKTLASMAETNDVAVITIGRISGEGNDRLIENFSLTQSENELIAKTADAFHKVGKKLIVILNIGGVIETASWKDIPDAILLSWQAGQEGGNSVTDILSGKQSPSGRLAVSFPAQFNDLGSSANFPINPGIKNDSGMNRTRIGMTDRNIDYTVYEEDIYVGYRWLQKHNIAASYPFGYGLSYTSFDWSEASVKTAKDGITASIKVTNCGATASKDVVELYISAPAGGLDKPVRELKAYAKTKELAPGESQVITMNVSLYDLASFNQDVMCWETAAGDYTASFGASCDDIKQNVAFSVSKAKSWKAPTSLQAK